MNVTVVRICIGDGRIDILGETSRHNISGVIGHQINRDMDLVFDLACNGRLTHARLFYVLSRL